MSKTCETAEVSIHDTGYLRFTLNKPKVPMKARFEGAVDMLDWLGRTVLVWELIQKVLFRVGSPNKRQLVHIEAETSVGGVGEPLPGVLHTVPSDELPSLMK